MVTDTVVFCLRKSFHTFQGTDKHCFSKTEPPATIVSMPGGCSTIIFPGNGLDDVVILNDRQLRSPDLTVCDFWLWAYLRDRVFQPPGIHFLSTRELEERIQQELNTVPQKMFRDAFRDFPKRCQRCLDENGGHFEK